MGKIMGAVSPENPRDSKVRELEAQHYRTQNLRLLRDNQETALKTLVGAIPDLSEQEVEERVEKLRLSEKEIAQIHDACQQEYANPDLLEGPVERGTLWSMRDIYTDDLKGFRKYLAESFISAYRRKGPEIWTEVEMSNFKVSPVMFIWEKTLASVKYLEPIRNPAF